MERGENSSIEQRRSFLDNFLEEDEDEANHGQIMQARQNRQSNQLGPNPAQIEERRIKKYGQMLRAKAEEFKQKKNHLELISNMTKYQMVFLKLETTLTKIGLRLKQKETMFKRHAFHKITVEINVKKANTIIMSGVIYSRFESKLDKFAVIIKRLEFLSRSHAFVKIKTSFNHSKVHQALKEKLRSMKDHFLTNMKKKETEIHAVRKTLKTQEETYSGLKSREVEIVKALNSKAKIIASLEQKKKPFPASSAVNENSVKKMKFYEEKIKEIEMENAELKDKIVSTENIVEIFLKQMNGLMESLEISTNDSQELNLSITNSNNPLMEEPPEVERHARVAKNVNYYKKNILNGVKENKILLSQENMLMSKK